MDQISGDRLLTLARSSDPASRQALLLALSDVCATRSFGLGDDAQTAEDVFLRLARGAELAVRTELATRLASTPWAPRALILLLAHDEIAAAEPVLTSSPVLREDDLVAIAEQLGQAHRRALATRPGLPVRACEAVARAREKNVIRVLLNNDTAEIGDGALRHCAAAAQDDPELWSGIVRREGLSEEVVVLACRHAGEALRREIHMRFPEHATAIETALAEAEAAAAQPRAEPGSATDRLVTELQHSGRLTTGFLIDAIDNGNFLLFERAIARLAGVRTDVVRAAIATRGPMGLALALRAAEMDAAAFGQLFRAFASAGRWRAALGENDRRRCSDIFRDMGVNEATHALRRFEAQA